MMRARRWPAWARSSALALMAATVAVIMLVGTQATRPMSGGTGRQLTQADRPLFIPERVFFEPNNDEDDKIEDYLLNVYIGDVELAEADPSIAAAGGGVCGMATAAPTHALPPRMRVPVSLATSRAWRHRPRCHALAGGCWSAAVVREHFRLREPAAGGEWRPGRQGRRRGSRARARPRLCPRQSARLCKGQRAVQP